MRYTDWREDSIDLYTMQFQVDIDGPVDVELLRSSAQAMLDRHPNLRAAFWDRDVPKPVQILPAGRSCHGSNGWRRQWNSSPSHDRSAVGRLI